MDETVVLLWSRQLLCYLVVNPRVLRLISFLILVAIVNIYVFNLY